MNYKHEDNSQTLTKNQFLVLSPTHHVGNLYNMAERILWRHWEK